MTQGGKQNVPRLPESTVSELKRFEQLKAKQEKHEIPSTLARMEDIKWYWLAYCYLPAEISRPGSSSIDIHYKKDIIATGCFDGKAVIFDLPSRKILSTLNGHVQKVTSVKFVGHDDLFLTGSVDKRVLIWQGLDDGNYECRHILKDHNAEVQAVTVHPTNNFFVTASLDNTWCFYELSSGICLTQVEGTSGSKGYTSAAFHPDGVVLGLGTLDALVKIWDVKNHKEIITFGGHAHPVTAMSFTEDGYSLAAGVFSTAASDGVKLWDLRNMVHFKTLAPYGSKKCTNSVEFDDSGSYLALAGANVRVYQVASDKSQCNFITTFPDFSATGKATCLKFGPDAKYLAVGSMDRCVRIFKPVKQARPGYIHWCK